VYIPDGEAPLGVVAWVHGGGFWMGDELGTWDGPCGRLAASAGVIVASLGYRLAPEHPYPAAVEDSWAGLHWVVAHAAEWGGAPERLAVAGGSAGGNLAAVLAQRARDEGGPALKLQMLTVPALNAGGEPTESMRSFSTGYGLDGIDQMRSAYHPTPAAMRHPWASPLLAARFDGLAPAVIHTAQFDPLRDEGELYAERLEAAGVPVEMRRFDGAIHGFLGSSASMAKAEELMAAAARRALASPAVR
jgi:acetyl esterase